MQNKLYRFLKFEGGLLTLESGQLRVSRWAKFNDPFDFSFGFDKNCNLTVSQRKDAIERFKSRLGKQFGVICFSRDSDEGEQDPIWTNPTMWGHYTDNHRGMVLEFSADIADGFWKDHLWKVGYSDVRPKFPKEECSSSDGYNILKNAGKTKASAWTYENESRLIVPLDDERLMFKNDDCFLPINSGFLTKIILGFKSPFDEESIRNLIVGKPYENVEIQRTSMSLSDYIMEMAAI